MNRALLTIHVAMMTRWMWRVYHYADAQEQGVGVALGWLRVSVGHDPRE